MSIESRRPLAGFLPPPPAKGPSSPSGPSLRRTVRKVPADADPAAQGQSHDAKAGAEHKTPADAFEGNGPGAHGASSPSMRGHEPLLQAAAHAAPSHGPQATKGASGVQEKKASLLSRVNTAFRGLLQDKNKLFYACILGGAATLVLALAVSNPALILVGLALLSGGVVGAVTHDPSKGAIKAPNVGTPAPTSGDGDDDSSDASLSPLAADLRRAAEQDKRLEAERLRDQHQDAAGPAASGSRARSAARSPEAVDLSLPPEARIVELPELPAGGPPPSTLGLDKAAGKQRETTVEDAHRHATEAEEDSDLEYVTATFDTAKDLGLSNSAGADRKKDA